MKHFALAFLPLMLLVSSPLKKEKVEWPTELATEVLLVFLVDTLTLDGLPSGKKGQAKAHNKYAQKINESTMEKLETYPYPYAVTSLSNYRRKVDVPEHRFVFRCPLLEAWNNNEVLGSRSTVAVADVYLTDVETGKQITIYESKPLSMHMMAHLLYKVKNDLGKQLK